MQRQTVSRTVYNNYPPPSLLTDRIEHPPHYFHGAAGWSHRNRLPLCFVTALTSCSEMSALVPAQELVDCVLVYLPLPYLGRLEGTCRFFSHARLEPNYRAAYGKGSPLHRSCSSYRTLAIEQYQVTTASDVPLEPQSIPDHIFNAFEETDERLAELAASFLIQLRQIPNPTSLIWRKAIATCLVAQRRLEKAAGYFEWKEPETMVLIACRI
jgi:hypothetical protein